MPPDDRREVSAGVSALVNITARLGSLVDAMSTSGEQGVNSRLLRICCIWETVWEYILLYRLYLVVCFNLIVVARLWEDLPVVGEWSTYVTVDMNGIYTMLISFGRPPRLTAEWFDSL